VATLDYLLIISLTLPDLSPSLTHLFPPTNLLIFLLSSIPQPSTPLIKLSKLSEATGCTIAVKAENLNPGGSVKDRAALYLIKEAEEKGG